MSETFGDLTTGEPLYVNGVFRMTIMFKTHGGRTVEGAAMGRVTEYAADLFARVLRLNGLDDYAWPPDELDVRPAKDFTGAVLTFATRAAKPGPVIIQ